MIVVIGATSWMGAARIVRAEVLQWKASDFVEAARALGAGATRILAVNILPNAAPSIIVTATLGVARAILVESALSYLGLRDSAADAIPREHAVERSELPVERAPSGLSGRGF